MNYELLFKTNPIYGELVEPTNPTCPEQAQRVEGSAVSKVEPSKCRTYFKRGICSLTGWSPNSLIFPAKIV
jgi:hypothetical protein